MIFLFIYFQIKKGPSIRYLLSVQLAGCFYWNKVANDWMNDGCEVTEKSTDEMLFCRYAMRTYKRISTKHFLAEYCNLYVLLSLKDASFSSDQLCMLVFTSDFEVISSKRPRKMQNKRDRVSTGKNVLCQNKSTR